MGNLFGNIQKNNGEEQNPDDAFGPESFPQIELETNTETPDETTPVTPDEVTPPAAEPTPIESTPIESTPVESTPIESTPIEPAPTEPQMPADPVTPTNEAAQTEIPPGPAGGEEQKEGVFTLFDQEKEGEEQENEGAMENIMAQKDKSKETGSILDTSALKKLKRFTPTTTLKEENYLTLTKIVLGFVVVLAFGVHIFFYTQLSPTFKLLGTNAIQKWTDTMEQSKVSYNDLIKKNLILAKFNLDEISNISEKYFDEKDEARKLEIKDQIINLYKTVKGQLTFDLIPIDSENQYTDRNEAIAAYQSHFLSMIEGEIADIKSKLSEKKFTSGQLKEGQIDIQILETVKKVYQQKPLRMQFITIDIENGNFDENLKKVVSNINNLSETNYSIIKQIQFRKIDWTNVILRIRELTTHIDPRHGDAKWKDFSSIIYTSFSLDNEKITISGTVKTKDNKNFTKIADLIDEFEKSPDFKDVTSRSFAKAYNKETNEYQSTLQLSLALQEEEKDELDETKEL